MSGRAAPPHPEIYIEYPLPPGTSFASFVLPSTFSDKFAISCFYFPQLMFCILTEARVFTLNVLNLAVWGLFWYRRRSCMLKIGTDPVAVRRNAFAIIL